MNTVKNSLFYFLLYSLVLGVIYPALVTALGQTLLYSKVNGSLLERNKVNVGSMFIGQEFKLAKYFWSRPSSTSPAPYNVMSSSGSNQSLTNPALQKSFQDRADALGSLESSIPVDLVTSSASGFDPEISVAAAKFQGKRVAEARGISLTRVEEVIQRNIKNRILGLFGEPRVNVLQLNLDMDSL